MNAAPSQGVRRLLVVGGVLQFGFSPSQRSAPAKNVLRRVEDHDAAIWSLARISGFKTTSQLSIGLSPSRSLLS